MFTTQLTPPRHLPLIAPQTISGLQTGFFPRGGKFSKTVFHAHTQYTTQGGVGTRLLISYVTVCLTIDPKDFRGPLLYAT